MLGTTKETVGLPTFRLLGSAEIGSSQGSVGAPKPRQLLSLLLMNAENLVSIDAVIDEIWSDRPPPSAVVTLQTYVLQVRRLLCRAGLTDGDGRQTLLSRFYGYVLAVNPDDLDAELFLQRARTARSLRRAGDLEATRKVLLDELGLDPSPTLECLQRSMLNAEDELMDVSRTPWEISA